MSWLSGNATKRVVMRMSRSAESLADVVEWTMSNSEPNTIQWQGILVIALILASFQAYSWIRLPVPSVNEPHYFAKAKHVWQPEWCAQDYFLQSSNPHLVYYRTVGALAAFLPFDAAAIWGRLVCHLVLTIGWALLVWAILRERWAPLWTAWAFLGLAATGNFSGEWLVGGAESKVVSYGFGFIALAGLARNRPIMGGINGGLAVAFHPVVGVWMGLSAVIGLLCRACGSVISRRVSADPPTDSVASELTTRTSATHWILGAIACLTIASTGLIPAMESITNSEVSADDVLKADVIQVYHRLGHHLNPVQFKRTAYAGYGLMFAVWLICGQHCKRVADLFNAGRPPADRDIKSQTTDPGESFWFACVLTSVMVAVAGIWVGFQAAEIESITDSAWHTKYLKLYPFRLADVLLPLVCSMAVIKWIYHASRPEGQRLANTNSNLHWRITMLTFSLMGYALLTESVDRNPSRMDPNRLKDWQDVCEWINTNSPADAVVHTPREAFAFKWFGQRAEAFSRKDCPQDSAGILEWYSRWHQLTAWGKKSDADGVFSQDELRLLAKGWNVTLLIARSTKRLDVQPIYANGTYAIFKCPAN